MTVGYQYEAPERSGYDGMIKELRQALSDMRRAGNRLKAVLEAREDELAGTKTQLRECVRELCGMCGEDKHPENGTCNTCRWRAVTEGEK